jgi:hypothetical protein
VLRLLVGLPFENEVTLSDFVFFDTPPPSHVHDTGSVVFYGIVDHSVSVRVGSASGLVGRIPHVSVC